MSLDKKLAETLARIEKGGAPKYHAKNAETGKLFARERIARLVDAESFVEDAAMANAVDPELPADGVVTGLARIGGRDVATAGIERAKNCGCSALVVTPISRRNSLSAPSIRAAERPPWRSDRRALVGDEMR